MLGQSILIVEPDAVRRDQLTQLLNQWGHHVKCVYSSDEVVIRTEARKPDRVFINADMPNSYRMVGEMRAAVSNVMVIVMSDLETQIGVMEQFKHLADDFLTLPVASVALEICLARVFRNMQLLNEVKNTCSQRRNSGTCENVAREVENERF